MAGQDRTFQISMTVAAIHAVGVNEPVMAT